MNIGRKLSEGVGSWLLFEQTCERGELFSEKYLSSAIGQILSGCGYRVTPEYSHPTLTKHFSGRGRRPAIDFVCREHHQRYDIVHGRNILNDPKKIIVAVESKWIGNSVPSFNDVFWDLIRLALIAHTEGGEGYFVLAGKKRDIIKYFTNNPFSAKTNNGRQQFLLRLGETYAQLRTSQYTHNKASLEPITQEWIPIIKELLIKYQEIDLPNALITQLSSIFPVEATATQFQVATWKITVPKDAGVIRASSSRFYSAT